MLKIEVVGSIAEVDQPYGGCLAGENPFSRYDYLAALEASGSVCQRTGWQPRHRLVYEDNAVVAVMPAYIKHHSYGEYVFDWSWADAYHQAGMEYYPKLLTSIPFTPSVGPRMISSEKSLKPELVRALFDDIKAECIVHGYSSWHYLFASETEQPLLREQGLAERQGCQYHWFNRDYRDYEDFLGALASRKRKSLKKERRHVEQQGISLYWLEGPDLDEKHLRTFYEFYAATYYKRGQEPYLNLDFFKRLRQHMPQQMTICFAADAQGRDVAGALFFKDAHTLYGRYWGCLEEYTMLHFECCYYQGIDYCIRHGLQRFDAGAQGEHKLQRGFEPVATFSYHWIQHSGFAGAIQQFVREEADHVARYIEHARTVLPYRQSTDKQINK